MAVSKLNIGIIIASFGLGFVVAQSISNQPTTAHHTPEKTNPNLSNDQTYHAGSLPSFAQSTHTGKLISQNNISDIQDIVAATPLPTVSSYLNKAFPNSDLSHINDKKKFSNRLIDELSSTNTPEQKLSGQLAISSNELMPRQSEDLAQVYKNQEIFAHFDSMGKFPQDSQVFVRWVNRDTGEILLFTPTMINKASQQNWTSFSPAHGWQAGNYDVKYYQMDDNLTPIAQASFTIKQVIQ